MQKTKLLVVVIVVTVVVVVGDIVWRVAGVGRLLTQCLSRGSTSVNGKCPDRPSNV